jgi:GNAT superfamily N-acetyltransferase
VIRPLGRPGDLGWVVMAHGELYAREFAWDTSFEVLVARIVADYAAGPADPRRGAWIAEWAERRAGCVFCVPGEERATARLRLLLVDAPGRGHGLGGRLVDTVIAHARSTGCERLVLWTNDPLAAARHIYLARGLRLTTEEPHDSFGVELVGQTYELDLTGGG